MAYAKKHFGVDLDPELYWTGILAHVAVSHEKHEWFNSVALWYQGAAGENASQDAAAHQLFAAGVRRAVNAPLGDFWNLDCLATIGEPWLQNGSVDMTQDEADEFGPRIAELLVHHAKHEKYAPILERLVLLSPRLWSYCGEILLARRPSPDGMKLSIETGIVDAGYFRHAPERFGHLDINSKRFLYTRMCTATNLQILKPSNIAAIFTGVHASTNAWKDALQLSLFKHKADVLAPYWERLVGAFSMLAYDVEDPAAWSVWATLHTNANHCAGLVSVLAAMQQENPVMHAAYTAYWPMIESMYRPAERAEVAANLSRQAQAKHIALPSDFVAAEIGMVK